MKADFLFAGLNLNTIVQEKTPETSTFHGWCFKNKHKYSNVETRFLFSPILKFLATRLFATGSVSKRYCGLFFTWSVWSCCFEYAAHCISELTKIELIIAIFDIIISI